MIVLKLVNVALDFIDSLALSANEAFAVTHFGLDGIEEQIVALFLLLLDRVQIAREHGRVRRLVNLDQILAASIDQEENASLSLFTELNAVLVDQAGDLHVFSHVKELD
mgnify:CR=1 FL=1